ncbi:MAG: IPT/TIG domain-containing protein [Minicystis sp.]
MTTITNDWDLILGTNEQFYSTLLTSLYDNGTLPHHAGGASYSLSFGAPTAALSSTKDTLAVTIPVLPGSTVTVHGSALAVQGNVAITVGLAAVGLSCVIQSDYLVPAGGSAAAGNPGTFTSAGCTLEAWIKTSESGVQDILFFGSYLDPAGPVLSMNGNLLSVAWYGVSCPSTDTTVIADGQWHHVAAVFTGGAVTFYKDGFAKDSVAIAPGSSSGGNLTIGGAAGGNAGFNGAIANVRVWSVARTAAQIQGAMNVFLGSGQPGLIGSYTFAGGTVVNEVNGARGQLHGGATIQSPSDDSIPYVFYLYVYDPSAITVACDLGSSAVDTIVEQGLSSALRNIAAGPIIGGQGTLTSVEKAALMPTTSQIITITSNGAPEVLWLAMTRNEAPPAGDPNTAFASDPGIAIASGSNTVMAISDYLLLDGLLLPEVADKLGVSASAFSCSQDPAILRLTEDVTVHQGGHSMKLTDLTFQVKNGGITFALEGIVSYFVVKISGTVCVAVKKASNGSEVLSVTMKNASVDIEPNQDDPTVIAIEALLGASGLFGLVGVLLQIFVTVILGMMMSAQSKLQAKLADLDKTKALGDTGRFVLNSVVFNQGVILQATLQPSSTSTGVTASATEKVATSNAPVIMAFSPGSGAAGTAVTITGSGFTGTSAVRFNGKDASYFRARGDGQIVAVVAEGTTTGPITVVTPAGSTTTPQSFTIAAAPTLTGLSPSSGKAGAMIKLTGTNLAEATSVVFSTGIPASFTATNTQVQATVPAGAVSGAITVDTPGGSASIDGFQVISSAPPSITSFTPTSGVPQTSVTITGSNFTGATGVSFGGTPASTFTVTSDTQIVAVVANRTVSGPVSVTNTAGSRSSQVSFTIAAAPVIDGLSPSAGAAGAKVTLAGQGFTGATAVTFGTPGIEADFTVQSDTQLVATVPLGSTSGSIAVTTPAGSASAAQRFTVESSAPPSLQSFSPTSGGIGSAVQIGGSNFTGTTGVSFGGIPAQVIAVTSDTALTAYVPQEAKSGSIAVTNTRGSVSSASAFDVVAAPEIQDFSPSHGKAGNPIVIKGSDFTGATAVTLGIDSTPVSFTVDSASRITAIVTSGSVSGPVTVTTPGGFRRASKSFTVDSSALPVVSGFAPISGKTGTSVTIEGSSFTGTTGVSFGGTPAKAYSVTSDGNIEAIVPQDAQSGAILVTNSLGTAASMASFGVDAAPSVSDFSPKAGKAGTTVTISGAGFTGATAVAFGDSATRASFTVQSDTKLVATVPSGSMSGAVAVTSANGTGKSASTFTVQSSAPPAIGSFAPTSGSPGTQVTISGTGFTGTTAVTFDGTPAAHFLVVSDDTLTATVDQGTASGVIGVSNTMGSAKSKASFTVSSAGASAAMAME